MEIDSPRYIALNSVRLLGCVYIQDSHFCGSLIQAAGWMDRQELSDAGWERIEPHLLGKASDPGRTGRDNRLFVEAVLWLARSGAHWRVLPKEFGRWHTVYQRFNRWCRSGP
ncbi:MAG: transposase [Tsuneonella suprasediminis]|uniref:Transposase n=1 Tax=Tsuneonella suprasediminis TaxID=2306996 RepID=A0A419R3Z4_9SPHN|nr:transposase [Tsuneonella suprasediminis]